MKGKENNISAVSLDRQLEALEQELADYQFLFRCTETPTIILDEKGKCLDRNDAFSKIIGDVKPEDLESFNPADYAPKKQPDGVDSAVRAAEEQKLVFESGSHCFEWMHQLPDGRQLLSEICVELIDYKNRSCARVQIRDISATRRLERLVSQRTSELESKKKELENLSMLDALTQIYNRRRFSEFCRLECARAFRNRSPMGIMILDIDFFKQYNDNYGHLAGDKCIIKVARLLKRELSRETDVFARWGGEEFIVLVSDTSLEDMKEIGEQLLHSIRAKKIRHDYSSVSPYLTVSIGGAVGIPREKESECHSLIKKADRLLYQVKESGRNNLRIENL